MTKAPGNLQELRRRIYRKAKSETTHRFWSLLVHITKIETLEEAYRIAKGDGGAPGIDGQSFPDTLACSPARRPGKDLNENKGLAFKPVLSQVAEEPFDHVQP